MKIKIREDGLTAGTCLQAAFFFLCSRAVNKRNTRRRERKREKKKGSHSHSPTSWRRNFRDNLTSVDERGGRRGRNIVSCGTLSTRKQRDPWRSLKKSILSHGFTIEPLMTNHEICHCTRARSSQSLQFRLNLSGLLRWTVLALVEISIFNWFGHLERGRRRNLAQGQLTS